MKRRLCGPHAVREALVARPGLLAMAWVTETAAAGQLREIVEQLTRAGVPVDFRTEHELDAVAAGVRHQGIVAIRGEDFAYADLHGLLEATPTLLVALDEVTDVHNFGAIVRSAVALGADGVITLRDRAAPVNAAVVRASAGATEHARIARVTNLVRTIETLQEQGFSAVGLVAESARSLDALDLTVPTLIVIGSEGRGLRRLVRERCSVLANVPMAGPLGSLNASVAAGIALYECARQRAGRAPTAAGASERT